MADLKTNYKDDVLDTSKNEKRKFRMIQNDDGTVSFEDATEYTQQGDNFGAADINATNAKINEQSQSLTYIYQSILGLNNAEMLDACSFYYNAFEVKVNIYCKPIAAGHISILNVGNLKPQIINYLSCSSSKSDSTAMCQINSDGQIIVTNASIGEYLQIGGSWVR